jgi:hypothetical protein
MSSDRVLAGLSTRELAALARRYREHVLRLARAPILSLGGLASGPAGRTRAHRVTLTEVETRSFDARVRREARLAESNVLLLAAARAIDAAMLARGYAPPQQLVPVPLSLDPKGGSARLFGNHLTMMMLALDRDDLADEARALARLAEQQRVLVRERLDVAMAAALELAVPLPPRVYRALMTRPLRGEIASFVFSNPGLVAIETFAGARALDAYALPAVELPPGVQVIASRFRGRLSVQVIHVDAALPAVEGEAIAARIRRDLVRGGASG